MPRSGWDAVSFDSSYFRSGELGFRICGHGLIHPFLAWESGDNESTNQLIWEYLPKGSRPPALPLVKR